MSSVVLVSPIAFGPDPQTKDNALIESLHVSNAKADTDRAQVCALVTELEAFFRRGCGIRTVVIHQAREPKPYRGPLEGRGESVCVAHSLSLHDVVSDDGAIERRLVVFYPMHPLRQGELARKQLVNQITTVAEGSASVELIDLRPFEEEGKYLEGSGSLVFAPGGRYVYMAVSSRSHPAVLEALCRPENLNIPAKNRFLLHCKALVPHTNVLGWCGAGICAWAIQSLVFDKEEEEVAFYDHLSTAYSRVLELSVAEMEKFAGSALEVPVQPLGEAAAPAHYALVLSETALAALQPRNRELLLEWYGKEHVHTFYSEVLERRCGTSLPSCIAASYTLGQRPPSPSQVPTIDVLRLGADK
ncbi:amidinotransferase [Novymonas esmeraldas]|uniref:Amidinotransferase n=1 Tax=Novymonas esmeraldas TaxID=1808958 RepID=A0AAW0EXU7_9TRYP